MLKLTCLKVANEISSLQFKLAPSAWLEISLVISIHVIFLHLAYVDNQPEIDCNTLLLILWILSSHIANYSKREKFHWAKILRFCGFKANRESFPVQSIMHYGLCPEDGIDLLN